LSKKEFGVDWTLFILVVTDGKSPGFEDGTGGAGEDAAKSAKSNHLGQKSALEYMADWKYGSYQHRV